MERKEPTIGSFEVDYAPPASRVDRGDPLNVPRKPWLALVAGIFWPPIGFAYAGRMGWAVVAVPVVVALLALAGQTGWIQSAVGAWSFLALAAIGFVGGIALPWWFARAGARQYHLHWFNRWYVYVALALVLSAPFSYIVSHKPQFLGFDTYRIPSASMSPTLMIGDFVMADTRPDVVAALHAGDVAIYTAKDRPGLSYVKRIVAGPGQHVRIDKNGLKVDGKPQSHAHTQGDDWTDAGWLKYPDVTLGADEFYLMGDNRGNSLDSRSEGAVPRANLVGKVTTIYYAADVARIGKVE